MKGSWLLAGIIAGGLIGGSGGAAAQMRTSHDAAPAPRHLVRIQDEVSAPKGLPPAPNYIPGTIITPLRDVVIPERADPSLPAAPAPAPGVAESAATEGRARESGATGSGATESGVVAVAAASAAKADPKIWRKLRPLVPEPGSFAVIPGSALRPVLVRKGEFDFCDQIKCHRSPSVIGAWNGGAFDATRGEFRVHGGGHADYGGNEVYVFDFASLEWTRETDPQPLTGPFLRDSDDDGTADACPAPAAGPPATHTYQGFVYVPKIDRYWLLGSVAYCAEGMGGSAAWEYNAASKTWTAMPELDAFGRFARAVVDPATGNLLVHVGRLRGWHEIDPATRQVVRSLTDDPFGSYIDGPAVFDAERRVVYALIGGRKTDRLVAYDWPAPGQSAGFGARLVAQWPANGMKAWGMAQHKSGALVLWDGGTGIVVVDPESGRSWEPAAESASGDSADGKSNAKVYSKWTYIPDLDVFFGISDVDRGVVLYRVADVGRGGGDADAARPASDAAAPALPPASVAIAPAATGIRTGIRTALRRAAPLEIAESASWEGVCATAVLCDPMGEGDVIHRGRVVESGPPRKGSKWRSIGQKFEHPEAVAAAPDPEVGGLRFTFPSNSSAGTAGNFKANFSPDYSFQVGPADAGAPAQEVYIQFQVRYSCTFIWTDCDPDSPNYRRERRCFLSKRGEGRCTASKVALISTGDREGFRADACTRIQTALNHSEDHALAAFHRCPRAQGFGERLGRVGGRYQGNSQPNGVYYCPSVRDDGRNSGWNATPDSCFRLIDDKWITIQVHLQFGAWQGERREGDPLSHVSIWAAIEGEDGGRQKLVIDNDFYAMDPEDPRDLVGKIWLMPHLYDKSPREAHPPFYVWYRNLVISETPIPNPA